MLFFLGDETNSGPERQLMNIVSYLGLRVGKSTTPLDPLASTTWSIDHMG